MGLKKDMSMYIRPKCLSFYLTTQAGTGIRTTHAISPIPPWGGVNKAGTVQIPANCNVDSSFINNNSSIIGIVLCKIMVIMGIVRTGLSW